MTMQEVRQIKENLSEIFWGKTVDEINNIIKPNVDEMKRKLDELRQKESTVA